MIALISQLTLCIYSFAQPLTESQQKLLKFIQNTPAFQKLDPSTFPDEGTAQVPRDLAELIQNGLKNHPQAIAFDLLKKELGDNWIHRAAQFGENLKTLRLEAVQDRAPRLVFRGADAAHDGAPEFTPLDLHTIVLLNAASRIRSQTPSGEINLATVGALFRDGAAESKAATNWILALASYHRSQTVLSWYRGRPGAEFLDRAMIDYEKIRRFLQGSVQTQQAGRTLPSLGKFVFGSVYSKNELAHWGDPLFEAEGQLRAASQAIITLVTSGDPAIQVVGETLLRCQSAFQFTIENDLHSEETKRAAEGWKRVAGALSGTKTAALREALLAVAPKLVPEEGPAVDSQGKPVWSENYDSVVVAALQSELWDSPPEAFVWEPSSPGDQSILPTEWLDLVTALSQSSVVSEPAFVAAFPGAARTVEQLKNGEFSARTQAWITSPNPWLNIGSSIFSDLVGSVIGASGDAMAPVRDWVNPYAAAVKSATAEYVKDLEARIDQLASEQETLFDEQAELRKSIAGKSAEAVPAETRAKLQTVDEKLRQNENENRRVNAMYESDAHAVDIAEALDLFRTLRGRLAQRLDRTEAVLQIASQQDPEATAVAIFVRTLENPEFLARINVVNDAVLNQQDLTAISNYSKVLRRVETASQRR